mgnify:FL=1
MRDVLLYAHILIGVALIILSILILFQLKQKSSPLKVYSALTSLLSWFLLLPSGNLYLTFYPATKTLIKAGSWPWAHYVIMETKEHWGLLIPIIATMATWLVFTGKREENRKWWILLLILTVLMGVLGRIVTVGGMAQ